jgi:N-6 DNA methylase
MEDQYLEVVRKHSKGKQGKRGCDSLAELYGRAIGAMEQTRGEMVDISGDVYQGSITYGEAGQFFSPMPLARLMASMTIGDVPEEDKYKVRSVADPACGSGRLLLAAAEIQPNWLFVGQDVDLRCVRMCSLNLALRNLYGYVLHGNSLANERRLVYRTGFDLTGFISEVALRDCPEPVQKIAVQSFRRPLEGAPTPTPLDQANHADTVDHEATLPRRTNQLRLF